MLLVGGGGREHALGWKISQSKLVEGVYYAPGNGGTINNLPLQASEFEKLASFARSKDCLTVVGPEWPISQGIVDYFLEHDLEIFGPTSRAARIETSKSFAKDLLKNEGIPTPEFRTFTDHEAAKNYVLNQPDDLVIKADGIAAGKGVVVCGNHQEAIDAIDELMVRKVFGPAGDKIVIEERIKGLEVSLIVLSDGNSTKAFCACKDYKKLADGELGPNTGGMGSFSPVPYVDNDWEKMVLENIINRTVTVLNSNSVPFIGFLYAGLMIDTRGKTYVLEFNARMGDPECQSLMVRLDSDLFEYLTHAVNYSLDELPAFRWKDCSSVCVVMTSKGYPSNYSKGQAIRGLKDTYPPGIRIFHSGTKRDLNGQIATNGGRVLSVTAIDSDLMEARHRAYEVVNEIAWGANEEYFRRDIGS